MLPGKIKLIALSGKAKCGKDTFARALVEKFSYRQHSFAEPIYRMLNSLPYLEHLRSQMDDKEKESDNGFYGISPRRMLQTLGTEWGRNQINQNLWIWLMEDKINRKIDVLRHGAFVISDLRFTNEAEWVRKQGGLVVRIHRNHELGVSRHVSEDGFPLRAQDVRISNDGTIEDFEAQASRIDDLAEQCRITVQS